MTIIVTWTDDRQETYACDSAHVADGVLWLVPARYPATGEPRRRIPLAGVRIWTEDD